MYEFDVAIDGVAFTFGSCWFALAAAAAIFGCANVCLGLHLLGRRARATSVSRSLIARNMAMGLAWGGLIASGDPHSVPHLVANFVAAIGGLALTRANVRAVAADLTRDWSAASEPAAA